MNLPARGWRRAAIAALLAAVLEPACAAAAADDAEAAARMASAQACWPADAVQLADDYLRRHGSSPHAAAVAQQRERALAAAEVLRRPGVMLFRQAFADAAAVGAESQAEVRLAALGDRDAIRRLADQAAEAGSPRAVGWLQYAAGLGDEGAAYALSLHYRRQDQPVLAQIHEARALALGFTPPPALEHARK